MYTYYNPYMDRGDYYKDNWNYNNRFGGFLVPFLLGGLGGAAIVGAYRPRPQTYYGPMPGYYNQGYYNQGYYPYGY